MSEINYSSHPLYGGNREINREYKPGDRAGSVVVPSSPDADNLGLAIGQPHPDEPREQLVIDTSGGVFNVVDTIKPKASIQPTIKTRKTKRMKTTTEPLLKQPERPTLTTTTQAPIVPTSKGKPTERVEFYINGMVLPVLYHEVIITGIILVLIADSNSEYFENIPKFTPNKPEEPYKIKVGTYGLACDYAGMTYEDRLGREHTIFIISDTQDLSQNQQ